MIWAGAQGAGLPPEWPAPLLEAAEACGLTQGYLPARVGVLRLRSEIGFILPSFYADTLAGVSEDVKRGLLVLLTNLLRRYEADTRLRDERLHGTPIVRGDSKLLTDLAEFDRIWRDFSAFGRLRRDHSQLHRGEMGAIDWPSTIAESNGWIESRSEGTFLPAVVTRRRRASVIGDLVDLFHHSMVSLAGAVLGHHLIGRRDELSIATALQSSKRLARELSRELVRTYRARERRILTSLRKLLADLSMDGGAADWTAPVFFLVEEFEYVWEDILRRGMYGPTSGTDIPSGVYTSERGGATKGIRPRPDLIIPVPPPAHGVIVVDAKYYSTQNGTVHGTAQDHYKQIVYSILLRQAGQRVALNLLAFPELRIDAQDQTRILRAHQWPEWPESEVIEIGINFDWIAKGYASESPVTDRDAFLAGIMARILSGELGAEGSH